MQFLYKLSTVLKRPGPTQTAELLLVTYTWWQFRDYYNKEAKGEAKMLLRLCHTNVKLLLPS
jgi:hypothetical protein